MSAEDRIVQEMLAREEMVLAALADAYQRRRMDYIHYSAAYDVTAARMAALSWVLSDSDTHPKDGDGEAAPLVSGAGPQGHRPEAPKTPPQIEP